MVDLEEQLSRFLSLFSGSEDRVALLDSTLKCVRGCDMMSKGENLLSLVREPIPNPMHDMTEASVYKNEKFYCCRIMPVKNSAGESDAYICEFISVEGARAIAERADIASELLPLYNAVTFNSSNIWESSGKLRDTFMKSGDYEKLSLALDIEGAMANISAVCRNAFEYANMLYSENQAAVIDAASLCRALGERCNAALAKCGRRIEVLVELEDLNIWADSRRAVVALMNAIQNALLYSPRDTEPIVAVYRKRDHGREFVEIQITNENVMFTSRDFKDRVDVNFSFQRLGYGIPIIKRFAQVCGGRFDMREENGRVIVTLMLPPAPGDPSCTVTLRSPELSFYSTGTPDIMDIMMMEVVQFFGEKTNTNS